MLVTNSLDAVWNNVCEVAAADLGRNAGMVVGVLRGGERRVAGYGALDAGQQPPDEHSVFEIGSITKVFTTLVLADMVLRGEVALDDPAQKYLPGTVKMPTWRGQEITLLHLATHTSSLPRLPENLGKTIKDQANPYANYQVSDMYEFLSGYKLKRPIGSCEEYSNLGLGLLGHLLGLVAGETYGELVSERVLRPLGMNDTSITLSADQERRLAPGHASDGKLTANWDTPALAGCGALRSTVNDMLTFMTASLNPATTPLEHAVRLCQCLYPKTAIARPSWKAYSFALLLSGLSCWVQWQFGLVPGNARFGFTVLVPMFVAAWFGGLGPGLLATAATVAGTYFLQYDHNFGWWVGFIVGGITSWLVSRRPGLRARGAMLAWQYQRLYLFDRGPRLVWHNGGTGGYASFVGFTRETEAAVVVLANSEKSVDSVGVDVLKLLN
jgi:D-alanyl-D-alanine-carboxypeptidase/D-alanyl-D-alanine-endopeptidase